MAAVVEVSDVAVKVGVDWARSFRGWVGRWWRFERPKVGSDWWCWSGAMVAIGAIAFVYWVADGVVTRGPRATGALATWVLSWSMGVTFLGARLVLVGVGTRLGWLFGAPVVILTLVSAIGLLLGGRPDENVSHFLVLLPGLVGSWVAALWARLLTRAGLTGPELVEALSTVRGLAVAWIALFLMMLLAVIVEKAGAVIDTGAIGGDVGGLLGLAATVAYAGAGYTEYRRGRAAAAVPDAVAVTA